MGEHVCVCIMHLSEHPAPLPLWPQRSCVNIHPHPPKAHPLTSKCVSEMQRNGVCVCSSYEQKQKGGGLLRNLEKEEKKWRGAGREGGGGGDGGDSFKRRRRGQISEKVEWDIWKRERVTETRRKLQLPNNDSLGKILFYISLSSLLSSNRST